MPSIKNRQRIIANNFISSSGLYRELYIPWQDILNAASAISGMSGSLAATQVSGSGPAALKFTGTSSGCNVAVAFRMPQDIAIAAPAAGSGALLADWTDVSGNSTSAVMSASVLYVPSGSEYTATSTSQNLGSATCTTFGSSVSANQNVTSTLVSFNFPTNRTGLVVIRFAVNGQDANHSVGANFALYGLRFRYLADRIGS